MDCSPPGSSVHGISQAKIVEWVAIPFSKGSSFICASVNGHLGYFHIFIIVYFYSYKHGYTNISLIPALNFLVMQSEVELLDDMVIQFYLFIFEDWNGHTVFHSRYTILHSQQQCTRIPIYLHPCKRFLSFLKRELQNLKFK